MTKNYTLQEFPPLADLETTAVLKAAARAHSKLALLRGTAKSLPNESILISTLSLQEALASSEIENIVTTHDEVLQLTPESNSGSPQAKEVARYSEALWHGYEELRKSELIRESTLIEMFRLITNRTDGFRTTIGTVLRNEATGEIVYTPPQDPQEIADLMRKLIEFVNTPEASDLDPLVKMALIHHQFESIHPFRDGNGRVGRILNILYLVRADLLDIPILYLSRGINDSKQMYYRLLQTVRTEATWERWMLYILNAVADTADSTLHLVNAIRDLMQSTKQGIRGRLPKIYSQDLINNLFLYPYTRVEYVARDLGIDKRTARRYLRELVNNDFVDEQKIGRSFCYINTQLVELLKQASATSLAKYV